MRDVVIAGYLRTANSRSKPTDPTKDWFHTLRADELLAIVLRELLERANIHSREVEDFIVGSALGIGEQWTYGGRTPLFLANLSESIPAKFVDQQCGSSMAALQTGFLEVAGGFADTVLVAGMEHMTRVPIGPSLYESGMAVLNPRLREDEVLAHWDMDVTMNMGMTAEKLFESIPQTRADLDGWAVRSHELAAKARADGFFKGEIVPVEAMQADGESMLVDRDQCVRPGTDLATLSGLKTPFKEDGVITAGNSSPLNAGASAMLLMTREAAEARGIRPMGVIRSMGLAGVDPTLMGTAPVPAARKALDKCGLSVEDMDFWEINEAFAVVVLNMLAEMGIDPARVNVKGGALALGHAMGATGIRLVGTLARILRQEGGRYGCAAACIGGGQGTATVIEAM